VESHAGRRPSTAGDYVLAGDRAGVVPAVELLLGTTPATDIIAGELLPAMAEAGRAGPAPVRVPAEKAGQPVRRQRPEEGRTRVRAIQESETRIQNCEKELRVAAAAFAGGPVAEDGVVVR
jgi:hypothetical protein